MTTSWRKSSYSQSPTSDCVEVAWRKSSYSDSPTSDCVEVALCAGALVRDSKNATGPVLRFGFRAWSDFIAGRGGTTP
jgi:Domain of unknown function (DUF397)